MKLSVIIVNYNVRFFLEQCLQSVFGAIKNIDAEVFVVDNNSVDGSITMVREKFPTVKVIANEKNAGFSAANNQAIRQSAGEYVLLLNPDTVVEEDTFRKCLGYFDTHTQTGALGVKMIDGKGNFLPESKRGLPTPWVSFYKIFGLAKLFPKSKKFGRYHLTYLDKNQPHKVDVLCGAFMMIRRKALDEAGLLDESFFMYGEDIDLSYRISKAGFDIVYFSETTIIHYKGESTKKSSLNYVYLFYKAMQIFARKHMSNDKAQWFYMVIQFAIWLRAFLSAAKRAIFRLLLPALDISLMYITISLTARLWGNYWFENPGYYPSEFFNTTLPAYILIWLFSLFFSGGYDSPVSLKNALKGVMSGTLIILILYALLPKDYHYSRMIIVAGTLAALAIVLINRYILSFTGIKRFEMHHGQQNRILVVGSEEECERVSLIIKSTGIHPGCIAFASVSNGNSVRFSGTVNQLPEMIRIYKADEIIFCQKDMPAYSIIRYMLLLANTGCNFKIAPPESNSIVGSNSINTAGDLYVYQANPFATSKNSRLKRTFDIAVSMLLLLFFPVWIFFKKDKTRTFKHIFEVLVSKKTWVSYGSVTPIKGARLKPGVYSVNDAYPKNYNAEMIEKLDLAYAQNYRISNDFRIFVKAFMYK